MRMNKLYLSSLVLAGSTFFSSAEATDCTPNQYNRPVCPANTMAEYASFIDPTATILNPDNVSIAPYSYIAPFASINAVAAVRIGEKTNLQDNVTLNAVAPISIGDEVILAHGSSVNGPATLGRTAIPGANNASFVGFNSLLDGATLQNDAMVLHLARVAPGITIRSGWVVLSGKNITTQAEADNPALGKVIPITDALRTFMAGVLHVNETFAREYSRLYYDNAANVTGVNYDPSDGGIIPGFNPSRDLPVLAGVATRDPAYRNRIIGKVVMENSLAQLYDNRVVGYGISLRADEGEPFHFGTIEYMGNNTTVHALEHTAVTTGQRIAYGMHSLVHGGKSVATQNNPEYETTVGSDTNIGNYAVVFRSVVGERSVIGCGSVVDGSTLPAATKIPPRTVVINYGHASAMIYPVEWNPGCRK